MARALEKGDNSNDFAVTSNVKQGCVLVPTMFSMVFSVMLLTIALADDHGIPTVYRTDVKLSTHARCVSCPKSQTQESGTSYSLLTVLSVP